jgi:hypothetical protein
MTTKTVMVTTWAPRGVPRQEILTDRQSWSENTVTCMSVTIDGFWSDDSIYCTLWYTTRDYTLQVTVTHTHTLMSTVTSSLLLLGSGFQQRTSPFFWVPELSPASATNFSQQRLTTSEPQQLSDWPTHQPTNSLTPLHWLTSLTSFSCL